MPLRYDVQSAKMDQQVLRINPQSCSSAMTNGMQLCKQVVAQYNAAELVWCQEEPKNMGCWPYVGPRLRTAFSHLLPAEMSNRALHFVGRFPAASTGNPW